MKVLAASITKLDLSEITDGIKVYTAVMQYGQMASAKLVGSGTPSLDIKQKLFLLPFNALPDVVAYMSNSCGMFYMHIDIDYSFKAGVIYFRIAGSERWLSCIFLNWEEDHYIEMKLNLLHPENSVDKIAQRIFKEILDGYNPNLPGESFKVIPHDMADWKELGWDNHAYYELYFSPI